MAGTVQHKGVECHDCGQSLAPSNIGPCPACGSSRRLHKVHVSDTIKVRADVGWTRTSEYFENHPWLLPLVVVLTLAAPFLGLFLAGPVGAVAGLALGVLTLLLGFIARTKVREIERGGQRSSTQ
jgi:DNA-directed RNA polymerase subunit RPC12/RpoP